MTPGTRSDEFGPWNSGIRSQSPRELLPLSTIFRPENVFTTVEPADGLSSTDLQLLAGALDNEETRAGFLTLVSDAVRSDGGVEAEPRVLDIDRFHTRGEWGGAAVTGNP